MREKGKIIKWNDERGFGFILPNDSQKNIFVHVKSFSDKRIRPAEGQLVSYTRQRNDDGKESAIDVSRSTDFFVNTKTGSNRNKGISQKNNRLNTNSISENKSSYSISPIYMMIIGSFMMFLLHYTIIGKLPVIIILIYIAMGIITYYIYSEDKDSAINNEIRTSEKKLLKLSLLGGWIGALVAQQRFRHKTKKASFQMDFWITVFINILLLVSAIK
jgi:uncharacterized membrane protein YsdA (DUF1294 family)/cold shock CspA family protein